jgi:hypothetical protein
MCCTVFSASTVGVKLWAALHKQLAAIQQFSLTFSIVWAQWRKKVFLQNPTRYPLKFKKILLLNTEALAMD